jgi:hypothetical protein
VPVDNVRRDSVELVRAPNGIAVLVDDRGADAFDEIMSGNARQSDAIILLETLFQAFE